MITHATRFLPIAKAVLLRAAQGGFELAAATAFPGAGPILSKALEPVFEEIGRKLGVDPTASPEAKRKAAELLETDRELQELVDAQLGRIIAPLRDIEVRQGELSEGQRQLLRVAEGSHEAIRKVAEQLDLTIETLITRGVTVADDSVTRIAREVVVRLESRERVEAEKRERRDRRFKEHVARTQARAVELVREKQLDRAADELKAGLELLETMLETASGDTHLAVQLGYFFKTMAQEFAKQGLVEQERAYNDRALGVFQSVVSGIPHRAKSVRDYADALNGLGNILYARRSYRAAAGYYQIVTTIDPTYAYAWHDLFGALYELAKRGDAEIAAARRALDMTRRTGTGQPGLGAAYLDACERRLKGLEAWLASAAGKGQAASGRHRDDFVTADARTRAGKARLACGGTEGALRELEAELRADPRFLEARSARGALLVGFGRLEEGLAELNAVIAEAPDDPEPHYNRACAQALKGDLSAALRDLARAAEVPWFRHQARSDPHLARLRDDPGSSACFAAILGEG